MIKEVEVKNTTEVLSSDTSLELDRMVYPDIVSAVLSSNGSVMTVRVYRDSAGGAYRKVGLYYMLPANDQQTVTEYELGVFGFTVNASPTDDYVFDLSPVLTTIITPTPEQLANDTVTIRVYTYEANISYDYGTSYALYSGATQYYIDDVVQYNGRLFLCIADSIGNLPTNNIYWQSNIVPSSGTKTLHAPYSVSYPSLIVAPQSTDGWYCARVLDILEYDAGTTYLSGEIVYDGTSGLYVAVDTSTGQSLTDTDYWLPMTAEEERNLYQFGYEDQGSGSVVTLLNTDMIVTRYVKQKYIYELLTKSNYKRYDNLTVVTQLEKIYAMREAAVVHLNSGNPIFARYLLDMIAIEVNSYTKNNGQRTIIESVNANYTL